MNYLVHLYLARPTAADRLGSLLGDYVKGPLDGRYSPEISAGIVRHRRIDAFAHTAVAFRRSVARIDPRFGHYRGVMVDIFYDHFMARDWALHHPVPLAEFAQDVYRLLHVHHDQLPVSMRQVAARMCADDWLTSYRDSGVVGLVLRRIGERMKRDNTLAEGVHELHTHYPELRDDFGIFLAAARDFLAKGR